MLKKQEVLEKIDEIRYNSRKGRDHYIYAQRLAPKGATAF
jgi:hypothetical protein